MVAGGIIATLNILTLIAILTPCCKKDVKIVKKLATVVALAMCAVTAWGSYVVFGKLNHIVLN